MVAVEARRADGDAAARSVALHVKAHLGRAVRHDEHRLGNGLNREEGSVAAPGEQPVLLDGEDHDAAGCGVVLVMSGEALELPAGQSDTRCA